MYTIKLTYLFVWSTIIWSSSTQVRDVDWWMGSPVAIDNQYNVAKCETPAIEEVGLSHQFD